MGMYSKLDTNRSLIEFHISDRMLVSKLHKYTHVRFIFPQSYYQFLSTVIAEVAGHIGATEAVVQDILVNLSRPLKGDIRTQFEPSTLCFKLVSIRDLKVGQKITGNC